MLKSGSEKNWTRSRRYQGVIRETSPYAVVWRCEHNHDAAKRALECATTELNRRKAENATS